MKYKNKNYYIIKLSYNKRYNIFDYTIERFKNYKIYRLLSTITKSTKLCKINFRFLRIYTVTEMKMKMKIIIILITTKAMIMIIKQTVKIVKKNQIMMIFLIIL